MKQANRKIKKTFKSCEELVRHLKENQSNWTTIDEIRYLFLDKIPSMWYNVINGVKQVKKWLPIIWKQRDWDYSYLYEMMIAKLSFIKEDLEKSAFQYVGIEKDIKWINIAIKLLNRIAEDEYLLNAENDGSEFGKEIAHYSFKKAKKLKDKDKKILYKILSRKIEGWWT